MSSRAHLPPSVASNPVLIRMRPATRLALYPMATRKYSVSVRFTTMAPGVGLPSACLRCFRSTANSTPKSTCRAANGQEVLEELTSLILPSRAHLESSTFHCFLASTSAWLPQIMLSSTTLTFPTPSIDSHGHLRPTQSSRDQHQSPPKGRITCNRSSYLTI